MSIHGGGTVWAPCLPLRPHAIAGSRLEEVTSLVDAAGRGTAVHVSIHCTVQLYMYCNTVPCTVQADGVRFASPTYSNPYM